MDYLEMLEEDGIDGLPAMREAAESLVPAIEWQIATCNPFNGEKHKTYKINIGPSEECGKVNGVDVILCKTHYEIACKKRKNFNILTTTNEWYGPNVQR